MKYCVRFRYLADAPGMTYTKKFNSSNDREEFINGRKGSIQIRAKWEEKDEG